MRVLYCSNRIRNRQNRMHTSAEELEIVPGISTAELLRGGLREKPGRRISWQYDGFMIYCRKQSEDKALVTVRKQE